MSSGRVNVGTPSWFDLIFKSFDGLGIFAGSYPLWHASIALKVDTNWSPSDLDFFTYDETSFQSATLLLMGSNHYKLVATTDKALTFEGEHCTLQIIKPKPDTNTPEKVLATFDFGVSMCYFTSPDTVRCLFLQDVQEKQLVMRFKHNKLRDVSVATQLLRVQKYLNRDYKMHIEKYVALFNDRKSEEEYRDKDYYIYKGGNGDAYP